MMQENVLEFILTLLEKVINLNNYGLNKSYIRFILTR